MARIASGDRPEPAAASHAAARFRFSPPTSTSTPLLRRRLIAAVAERWSRRAVVVTAGPGFGKTTLLSEALAENAMAPRGTDVWLTCQRGDTTALAVGLASALSIEPPVEGQEVSAIADAVWSRAPAQVSLVLDDVHLITPGSAGALLVEELLAALPENGHLVLAGRPPMPVRLARWMAAGHVVQLGEDDLRFTADEASAFADLRGVDPDQVARVGGWPALAELAVMAGGETGEFLWQEVLDQVPVERRRQLAAIAAVGPVDDDLASAAVGDSVSVDDIVRGVPLVARTERWCTLHPLWHEHLAASIDVHELDRVRRRTVHALLARDDVDRAFDLLAEAGAWDVVGPLILQACSGSHALVAPATLVRWLDAMPVVARRSPEGELLQAMARKTARFGDAGELLEGARQGFQDRGDAAGEVVCLRNLVHLAQETWDVTGLVRATQRAAELEAEGSPVAAGLASFGRALMKTVDDPRGARDDLVEVARDEPHRETAALVEWYAFVQHYALGDGDSALAAARRARDRARGMLRPVAMDAERLSLWMLGRLEEASACEPLLLTEMDRVGAARNIAITRAHSALASACFGDVTAAEAHLAIARRLDPASQGPTVAATFAGAEVMVAVARRDFDRARALMRAEMAVHPLGNPQMASHHHTIAGMLYVLLPEAREHFDGLEMAPAFATGRALAQALVDARERGSLDRVRALEWPSIGVLRSRLPFPWAVELTVAGVAAGCAAARALLDDLGDPAIPIVRDLATEPSRVIARAARYLAATLPTVPADRIEIFALGPLCVTRDGVLLDDAALRRDRVRSMLGYLIEHISTSRDALAAALWPDLDPDAARNNLRVNLNHLVRALEPGRDAGRPSFFVRQHGPMITLAGGDHLAVDVWTFEARLDEALRADRDGVPSLALDGLLAAIDLYRGPYLEDTTSEWAELDRQRLRSRFVEAAVRASELLVAAGDPTRGAQVAVRALDADEWSERAHRALASAYAATGDRAGAIRALDACDVALAELGTEPEPATVALRRAMTVGG